MSPAGRGARGAGRDVRLSPYAQAVGASPLCPVMQNVHVFEQDVDVLHHPSTGAVDSLGDCGDLDLDTLDRLRSDAFDWFRIKGVPSYFRPDQIRDFAISSQRRAPAARAALCVFIRRCECTESNRERHRLRGLRSRVTRGLRGCPIYL